MKRFTKTQLIMAGIIGLVLTYFLGARALSTGSYWQYSGALILLVLSFRLLVIAIRGNGK